MSTSSPLLWLGLAALLLPVTVSDSSIFSLPLGAGRGGGGDGAGAEGAEFPLYNSSKGVNITIPANYSRHSLPSGALTRVNIGAASETLNHDTGHLLWWTQQLLESRNLCMEAFIIITPTSNI